MLIGLVGYAQSGKSTVADMLANEYGFHHMGFAEALREMAWAVNPIVDYADGHFTRYADALQELGYEGAKARYPELRRFLQVLGTEGVRDVLGANTWVETAMKRAEKHHKVVFADCRFDNEIGAIWRQGGAVWLIKRAGIGPVNNHSSETLAGTVRADRVIVNDGTLAELAGQIRLTLGKGIVKKCLTMRERDEHKYDAKLRR